MYRILNFIRNSGFVLDQVLLKADLLLKSIYVYGTNVLIYNAVYGYSHVDYHRFNS